MTDAEHSGGAWSLRDLLSHEFVISIALVALALLALVHHLHTEAGVLGVTGYGQAIELQASQRLYVERLSRQALQAWYADSDAEITRIRAELTGTAATIESVQARLLSDDGDSALPAPVRDSVRKVYEDLPQPLPAALASYIANATRVAEGQPADDLSTFDRLQQDRRSLIGLISAAATGLQVEEQARLRAIKAWNLVYLAVTILTLFVLAFFVLRPIYSRIRAEHAALAQDKSELERLSAERAEELYFSEQKLRAIMDTSADGICTLDSHGNIMSFNRAAEQMFGLESDEVVGTNIAMLLPEARRERHGARLRSALYANPEGQLEVAAEHVSGRVFDLEISFREQVGARKRLFTVILRDQTERRRVEMLKDEFISMVSHELRTPLTSIRGSLGLLQGGAMGEMPPRVASLVEIAASNSERLVRLINDILDIEKIDAGKMSMRLHRLDLVDCVRQAVEGNGTYAVRSGVRLRLVSSPASVTVQADGDRLRQVMDNLLSNALKHSPQGASVDVAIAEKLGTVQVSVTDRGPGIDAEFQSRIFDRFSQADSSTTRQHGGTGLGLSISKAIVERLGGSIGFDTTRGSGTSFYFDLPVLSAELTQPVADVQVRRAPVLVVEDDPDVARLLVLVLEKEGIEAEIATDAEQARVMLKAHDYRAITLDLMLPDQDGISLLRDLRRDARTSELPVVVVSAVADTVHARLNGSAVGVVDWLGKPIDEEQLRTAVRHALRHSHGDLPKVLHVEDDADISRTIGAMLEGHASVHSATTLEAGRRRLSAERYDLVILDIGLPDGSGIELLPDVNSRDNPPPVIVFSARDVDAEVTRQVSAALVKSRASNDELVEQIRRALPSKSIDIGRHV